MKIIGITGGIGSGKTTIAKIFESYQIPVYYADFEAKALMNRSKIIRRKLTALLGDETYINGKINRKYIASKVFNNDELLKRINAIVHPKVGQHFKRWLKKQDSTFVLKESAIIFENNLQDNYDAIILVVANKENRIERVVKRDGLSKQQILSIINNQLSEEEKIPLATYIINNNSLLEAEHQTRNIYKELMK